jgi:hypothetical protein
MAKNVILLICHSVTVLMLDMFNSNDRLFNSCHFGSALTGAASMKLKYFLGTDVGR